MKIVTQTKCKNKIQHKNVPSNYFMSIKQIFDDISQWFVL